MDSFSNIGGVLLRKAQNSAQPKRPQKNLDDIHASVSQLVDYIRQSNDLPAQIKALGNKIGLVDKRQKDQAAHAQTITQNISFTGKTATTASNTANTASAKGQVGIEKEPAAPLPPPGPVVYSPAYGWFLTEKNIKVGMYVLTGSDGSSAGIGFEASQWFVKADGVTDGYQPIFARSGKSLVFNVAFKLDGADLFDGTVSNTALAAGSVSGGLTVEGALSAQADYTIRRDTSLVFVTARFLYRDDPATLNSGKKGQLQISVDGAALISIVNNDVSQGATISGDRGYIETLYTFQMANPTKGKHSFKAVSTWDTSLGTDTKVNIQVLEFAA